MHTTHNNNECRCYNKNRFHEKAGRVPKPSKPASGKDGINFAKLISAKTKNALCSALIRLIMERSIIIATKRVISILTLTTELLGWIAQVIYMR